MNMSQQCALAANKATASCSRQSIESKWREVILPLCLYWWDTSGSGLSSIRKVQIYWIESNEGPQRWLMIFFFCEERLRGVRLFNLERRTLRGILPMCRSVCWDEEEESRLWCPVRQWAQKARQDKTWQWAQIETHGTSSECFYCEGALTVE